jgi:hypothetical protein
MSKLLFLSSEELRQFYLNQGYFAIYDCTTEYGEVEIEHYSLMKSRETISRECVASQIISLNDDAVLTILDHFLKSGTVYIHPNHFTI